MTGVKTIVEVLPRTATVREATFALLRELGMTTIFGNPGSTELRFLKDFPRDFRYVMGLHEGCSVAMADAYAQVTGNAAFVSLHSAGGLGNAMGTVYTAYRNAAPLVIMAGQQTRAMLGLRPVPLRARRGDVSATVREVERRAGARRRRPGGDRSGLRSRDGAAVRADVRLGPGRRLGSRDERCSPRGASMATSWPTAARSKCVAAALAASPSTGAGRWCRRRP